MVEDNEEGGQDEEEDDYPFHQGMPPGFPAALGGLGGLQLGMGMGAGMASRCLHLKFEHRVQTL